MAAYIVRRLLHALVVVLIVSFFVFFAIRQLPGDPILMYVASGDLQSFTKEQVDQIKHELGLDRPVIVQYVDWLAHVIRGDFGKSLLHKYDVLSEIRRRLPITLHIGLLSFAIGFVVGPIFGIISAVRRGKWTDSLVTLMANIGITAPPFWIGIILIYLLGLYLGLLPIYGYTSPLQDFWKSCKQVVMPVLVLATFSIAGSARQMRASVLEVLRQDYIRTAWSKGLTERAVIAKHVLKNALIPVITLQGILLRNIVGGSVIVETVFFIPGMGKLVVDSMLAQDYMVVQGVILVFSIATVLANLIVDIAYGWLDPRIQYE